MSNEPRQLLGPLSQSLLRDCWRDRTAGWPLSELQQAVVGMSRPPWWRLIARWKWRKTARNMCRPQPGLSGWKAIDPKAPASVAAFAPAAFVLPDPLPARYASLEDAAADRAEGTRKRAIRPYDKVGGRVFLRREYRDAPIGVGIVWGSEVYAVAYRETE